MNDSNKSKWRFLWALPISIMILTSVPKIFSMDFMVENMEAAGMEISLPLLGLIELACAVIFLIPRTRNIGFLLAASFLGGVIATEWIHPPHIPVTGIVLQICLWTGMYFEAKPFFKISPAAREASV